MDVMHRVARLVFANPRDVLTVLEQPCRRCRPAERQPASEPERDGHAGLRHHEERSLGEEATADRGQIEGVGQLHVQLLQPVLAPLGGDHREPEGHVRPAGDRQPSPMAPERRGLRGGLGQQAGGEAGHHPDDRQGQSLRVADLDP
jgi:hypothetical protein